MKTLITGASGFIGKALLRQLISSNQIVTILSRDCVAAQKKLLHTPSFCENWDPVLDLPPLRGLEQADVVVHLAGEPIGEGRWTARRKKNIFESRVKGTQHLVQAIQGLRDSGKSFPKVFISASAVGFYGNKGNEWLDEALTPGAGFLADVCQAWEKETLSFREKVGGRVVVLRFGIVLGSQGGVLKKMLPVFRLGLGGQLGSGKQWLSWIHIQDLVRLIEFVISHESLDGIFNVVAPHPVTNAQFMKELGRVLTRPVVFRIPAAGLKFFLGDRTELILFSQKCSSKKIEAHGFQFLFPSLPRALQDIQFRHD